MDELYAEIKKSFSEIEMLFDKVQLYNLCGYDKLCDCHFGLGTWIRNNLLDESSNLYSLFLKGGVMQKDDMSGLIIRLFYINSFARFHPSE